MKIYAFQVEQKGPRALNTLIDRIRPVDLQDRFYGDMGLRLEDSGRQQGLILMDFARERRGHGPGHMHRTTPLRGFRLAAGESFAEDTGVAFDPATGYAAVQYNHAGPRSVVIERYLRAADISFGGIAAKGEGEHDQDVAGFLIGGVLKRGAYQRIRQFGFIREVEFAVSLPGLDTDDLDAGRSVGGAIKAAEAAGVAVLDMKLKAGAPRNSTLDQGSFREIVHDMRALGTNLVKAKVRGKGDARERVETIDLIKEQVVREVGLTVGRDGRYTQADRWGALANTLTDWVGSGALAAGRA